MARLNGASFPAPSLVESRAVLLLFLGSIVCTFASGMTAGISESCGCAFWMMDIAAVIAATRFL